MTAASALRDGINRVNRAPVILACVFAVTLVAALPFSMLMHDALQAHLGSSMAAEHAARGVHAQWWTEFTAQAGPLGQTFATTIIGFAAVLDNLSTLLDAQSRTPAILWLGAAYLLLWLFLSGGILDRYARARPTRGYEFFAACGVYFIRFLRLAPVIALVYYALFSFVHPLLFVSLYEELTRDVTVERTAFFWRLGLYALFGSSLILASILFDYAKVRAVVEDRRSMIGALVSGLRFVRRNAGAVALLYVLNGLMFVGVLLVYALAAPGAGSSGAGMWLGVAISQMYLLARLWVRLVFFASETSLFQGRLAHAGYVAGRAAAPPRAARGGALRRSRTAVVIARGLDAVVVLVAAALLLIAATGGTEFGFGPLRIRLHDWARPLVILVIAVAALAWLTRRTPVSRAPLGTYVAARGLLVLLIAAAGIYANFHVRVAGGLDSYGYVSAAHLLASGSLREAQPLAQLLPFDHPMSAAAPLGHVPSADGRTSVPRFPLGLPIVMAIFTMFGSSGPFFVPLVMAFAAIALAYLLGRDTAVAGASGHIPGLFAATLLAVDPLFAAYAIQPMSDVPATAWLLAAVWMTSDEKELRRPFLWRRGSAPAWPSSLALRLLPAVAVLALATPARNVAFGGDGRNVCRATADAQRRALWRASVPRDTVRPRTCSSCRHRDCSQTSRTSAAGSRIRTRRCSGFCGPARCSCFGVSDPPGTCRPSPLPPQFLICSTWSSTIGNLRGSCCRRSRSFWSSSRALWRTSRTRLRAMRFGAASLATHRTPRTYRTWPCWRWRSPAPPPRTSSSNGKASIVWRRSRPNTCSPASGSKRIHRSVSSSWPDFIAVRFRLYGGRATVRWDQIPEQALTATLRALIAAGYEPYLALDLPSEPALFDERFQKQPLHTEQTARVRVVNIYKFMSAY